MGQGYHTRIVRARAEFREYHTAIGQEELHTPDTGTGEGGRYFSRHIHSILQVLP